MKLKTYSDGGARGNPGPAAIGVVICTAGTQEQVVFEHLDVIGDATNNIAEYCALIAALTLAKELGAEEVDAFLDSELVVRQLGGIYKIKTEHIRKLVAEVRQAENKFKKVTYRHVPRTHDRLAQADKLVNRALDEAGA